MKKKILLSANSYWNLFNFRKELIKNLHSNKNYELHLLAPPDHKINFFKQMGCKCHIINYKRNKKNFFESIKIFFVYLNFVKKIKPSIFLPFTIKPNIFGSLACQFLTVPVVNNITGLGSGFLNSNILRICLIFLYKIALKKSKTIFFHNQSDRNYFIQKKIINLKNQKAIVLPGSGINTDYFKVPLKKIKSRINFLYVGRLIRDKGIFELFESIKKIKKIFRHIDFTIVGNVDKENLFPILKSDLDLMIKKKLIKYYKFNDKVIGYYKKADCFVMPSYREGLSRSLLEAASCSLALIATDVPGCRELVRKNYNGFLCNPKDSSSLYSAIKKFIKLSKVRKKKFKINSRKLVVKKYNVRIVIKKYINEISKT